MSTTKLTLLAILTFSTLTAARAGVSPAWKGEDFIMEEVVVRAAPLPGFYPDEVAEAPARLHMEEIVVTARPPALSVKAERPRVDIHPGTIKPPALPQRPNTDQPVAENDAASEDADGSRSYAARDASLRARRLL